MQCDAPAGGSSTHPLCDCPGRPSGKLQRQRRRRDRRSDGPDPHAPVTGRIAMGERDVHAPGRASPGHARVTQRPRTPPPSIPATAATASLSEVSPVTPTAPITAARRILHQNATRHRHHLAAIGPVHGGHEIGLRLGPRHSVPNRACQASRHHRPCRARSRTGPGSRRFSRSKASTCPPASRTTTESGFSPISRPRRARDLDHHPRLIQRNHLKSSLMRSRIPFIFPKIRRGSGGKSPQRQHRNPSCRLPLQPPCDEAPGSV